MIQLSLGAFIPSQHVQHRGTSVGQLVHVSHSAGMVSPQTEVHVPTSLEHVVQVSPESIALFPHKGNAIVSLSVIGTVVIGPAVGIVFMIPFSIGFIIKLSLVIPMRDVIFF